MAAAISQDFVSSLISDKWEEVSHCGNHQCCLLMKNNIQALEKEVKSLTEIINILSEKWKHNETTEEVRMADGTYADKRKLINTINCNCDKIKPQLLLAQKEICSLKAIIDLLREDLKSMIQTTNMNMFPVSSCSNDKLNKYTATSEPKPMHSKTRTKDYSQYSIPTMNRFDILSNYQELQYNKPEYTSDLDCSLRSFPKTRNSQHKSLYLKKLSRRNVTTTQSYYPLDKHNLNKTVMKEDGINHIPTIVNGVTSKTTNQETKLEASEVPSDMNGEMINSVIINLR
jgi:hypothetical protein